MNETDTCSRCRAEIDPETTRGHTVRSCYLAGDFGFWGEPWNADKPADVICGSWGPRIATSRSRRTVARMLLHKASGCFAGVPCVSKEDAGDTEARARNRPAAT